ncbi:CCB4, partial [Symbiodinium natans]
MAMLAPPPARAPAPPTESLASHGPAHGARVAGALTAAAAAVAARRPELARSKVLLRAAGSDFAIIRFRIPGVDDLTLLPRVVTAFCAALFVYNKVSASGDPDSFRQVSETLAVVLSVLTWSIPWVTGRLEEAVRRQVDAKPSSRKPGSIQTLAIKQDLSEDLQVDISWLSSSLLRLTNADGLAIWNEGSAICSRGIVKRLKGFAAGAEFVLQGLDAVWTPGSDPVDGYCATRRGLEAFPEKLLPQRVLPGDTESAIIKPLPGGGHLVLWSARPRAFDKEADRLWIQNAAAKLGGLLHGPKSTVPDTVMEECFEDTLPLLVAEEDAEASRDPFARFDLQIRVAPTIVGVMGLGVLIFNRQALVFSEASRMGVDPAQTRADLCAGVLAITLVLQGLVWVSETPKAPDVEDTTQWDDSRNVLWVDPQLAEGACQELVWSWSAFSSATRACSMALFWRDKCVMQGGLFQPGMEPVQRGFCQEVISMGKGRYLAQLNNYPAKEEFLDFFPRKTQGLLLTPLRPARNAPA